MWEKIYNGLGDILVLVGVGVTAGVMRTLISPANRSLKDYLVTFFFSIPVGVVAGSLMMEYGLGVWLAITVASGAALLGRDIIVAIVDHKTYIGNLMKKKLEKWMG